MYHVAITDGWYNIYQVGTILRTRHADLIIIDGPVGELRKNLPVSLFKDVKCPVVFDDTNRTDDYSKMMEFCEKLDFKPKIFSDKNKGWSWCVKNK